MPHEAIRFFLLSFVVTVTVTGCDRERDVGTIAATPRSASGRIVVAEAEVAYVSSRQVSTRPVVSDGRHDRSPGGVTRAVPVVQASSNTTSGQAAVVKAVPSPVERAPLGARTGY